MVNFRLLVETLRFALCARLQFATKRCWVEGEVNRLMRPMFKSEQRRGLEFDTQEQLTCAGLDKLPVSERRMSHEFHPDVLPIRTVRERSQAARLR